MQEVKDEQMRISLHHKNLTLEIALVLRFANTITYSNEYNLAIVFDPEPFGSERLDLSSSTSLEAELLRPKGSLSSA